VADDAQLGENVYIVKSIIGKNCKIGDNTKIANSIIMFNT
jgi:NDP-sugar pyrophosphorylase family protein